MKLDLRISAKFARISFLAAAFIVLLHMYLRDYDSLFVRTVCKGATHWAVPYFFFAAGFLLFKNYNTTIIWYKDTLLKRIRTILVPYLLWGGIATVVAYLLFISGLCSRVAPFSVNRISWWLDAIGISVTAPPLYAGHFWFLRMLISFVLISPIIAFLVRRIGYAIVWVLAGLYVINAPSAWTWECLSFFYFGAFVSLRSPWLLNIRVRFPVVVLLALVWCFFCCLNAVDGDLGSFMTRFCEMCVNWIGLFFVWFSYDYIELKLGFLDPISSFSFFIYCSHHVFMQLVKIPVKMIYLHWLPAIVPILISAILTLLFCLGLAFLVQRTVPGLYCALVGGRVLAHK